MLEVLIASVILVIGVSALIYTIAFSLQKSRDPYDRSVAMDLAQQKLEDLRNEEYSLLASGRGCRWTGESSIHQLVWPAGRDVHQDLGSAGKRADGWDQDCHGHRHVAQQG